MLGSREAKQGKGPNCRKQGRKEQFSDLIIQTTKNPQLNRNTLVKGKGRQAGSYMYRFKINTVGCNWGMRDRWAGGCGSQVTSSSWKV